MKRKWVVSAVVTAVVVGAWWWHSAHAVKAEAAADVKIVTVERGEVKQVVMASGKISANNEVDIKCKASGEVVSLPFDESDVVTKGAQVLQLDPVDEQRAVDQAKAALTAAECKVTTAKDTLAIAEQTVITDTTQAESTEKSAEINAEDMRAKAQRTKQLFDAKQESEEQRESDEAAAKRAELAVDDAKTAIEALKTRPISIDMDRNAVTEAEVDVETARSQLADAEQRLKETKVVAPIDGVVTTRPAQIGTIVSSGITNVGGGTSIMTVVDLSRLWVLAPVDEADIGKVKREQKVTITCDAYPDKKFDGKILRIAAKGTNTQNVVTFEVKIEVLGEGKELLKPEMSTDVEIVVADREKVLRVPSEAVKTREKDKKKYVLVPVEGGGGSATQAASAPATGTGAPQKKMKTVERDVEVGVDDGTFCEIVSGLKEKEKVVIDGGGSDWSKLKLRDDSD
jgi:HlyD family secretion protein